MTSNSKHDISNADWRFDNTYSRLPEVFFAPATPAKVRAPRLSILNLRLADELGLPPARDAAWHGALFGKLRPQVARAPVLVAAVCGGTNTG